MNAKAFLDTNIIIYLLSADRRKADISDGLVAVGGFVSVQVLNEFASFGLRKLKLSLTEVEQVLAAVRANCTVVDLSVETHELGLKLIHRYAFSLYDAMIISAAIRAGAQTLYSEDMQDGLRVDGALSIVNPYK